MKPDQILGARKSLNLSRLRLSALAGVHESMVRKAEQGIAVPADRLLAIAETLTALTFVRSLRTGGRMHDDLIDALNPPDAGPGWYAAFYCWDQEEGVFAGATWWSGSDWRWLPKRPGRPPTLAYHPRRYATQGEAAAAAERLEVLV